jgi:hypothetical protein
VLRFVLHAPIIACPVQDARGIREKSGRVSAWGTRGYGGAGEVVRRKARRGSHMGLPAPLYMEHHVLQLKGLLKNLGTPTIIKKQGLLENSKLYKNMNWKERLKALVLEGYKPGSTRTRVIDHQSGEEIEGVGSTRATPPQPDPAVDAALRRIHQQKNKKKKQTK